MGTTFNLETQITLRKSQLSANGQFNKDNIAELESQGLEIFKIYSKNMGK